MPGRKKKKALPNRQRRSRESTAFETVVVDAAPPGRCGSGLSIAALLTATFVWSCSPMTGFDIWWHLKTGQLIIERQTLPFVDWFTYSDSDAAWVDLHWGFQLLAAATYATGGVPLLVLAKATLITTTVAVGLFAGRTNFDRGLPVAIWSLVAVVLTGRGIVRPEILSLVFLATWLSILLRTDHRPNRLWLLPLMLIL